MTTPTMVAADDLLDRIVELARTRSEGARGDEIELFLRHYYRRLPAEDIQGRDTEDLYFSALGMLNFMRSRDPGLDKLRVYNPSLDADGWSSPHTVVDLITEDRPFLVDSLTAALSEADITVHLVVHPVFRSVRDGSGELGELRARGQTSETSILESVSRIEIGRLAGEDEIAALTQSLADVLDDIRVTVEDWRSMRETLDSAIGELVNSAPPPRTELDETVAFLSWMAANNFTFLGYCSYDLTRNSRGARLKGKTNSALGLYRGATIAAEGPPPARGEVVPGEVLDRLTDPSLVQITKNHRKSTVHRPTQMDSVEIKRYDADGAVIGVHRFIGLYTSAAYNQSPTVVPVLRQRLAIALARAGFSPTSHDGKALLHVLETYPRDELFQASEDELLETSLGILHLQERPRLRLFVRRDTLGGSISCLVFLPRERFDSGLRRKITQTLEDSFGGTCQDFYTQLGDSPLARLHIILQCKATATPALDTYVVEGRLVDAVRGWEDNLHDALQAAYDEHRAASLEQRYAPSFPSSYRDRFGARAAVLDIERIEAMTEDDGLELNLYRPPEATQGGLRFKIYHRGSPLALSDVLPVVENMGLKVIDEFPFRLVFGDDLPELWIHDFGVVDRTGMEIDVAESKLRFQRAFEQIWRGLAENDGFNMLITRAGLTWRQVVVLRSFAKYLRQARIPFSQAYMEATLSANPEIARHLVEVFEQRFDPTLVENRRDDEVADEIMTALDSVASLDEDRIIRRFLNVIQATQRTNFYQKDADGAPHPYISLKIDSKAVDELPLPRPDVEIFVYSSRMEGVHLRGGKVARGGLRWSDRPEDFRTEVLGLMKAQMVKNAVIVPVGAKGGFVVKQPPVGDRDAFLAEGVACYEMLISGMLDITDNFHGADVVPPVDVVRHDGDDPYLVVAADKGTATFSDIANGVAEDYGFWLGDAFASGGSVGYDHKKMGITARGAWESVKRHFREMGIDTQNEVFSVVGIGDMSGDVFGNGMLLSRHIKLLAAFNHLHIFIDPDPDPEASFAERKRLFDLPRSNWADYEAKLISKGGGIFDRAAKSLTLTPEMRALIGVEDDTMTPTQLISALLKAPVDLLWNGGIGTYVKARSETHADAGDRANDALRIDATDLRCKVIGEGGNLGFTQLSRIEASNNGVRVNSDAIDNSAGVDCSDREVNIKVLLGDVETDGELTRKQRDKLLVKMTDDVAERCLADNYLQTLGISVIESLAATRLDLQQRMIHELERSGRLDRTVENLPDDETIEERRTAEQGLSRPEISVLYAYAKLALYDELLASDLPDDPFLVEDLERYFPGALVKKYGKNIRRHRLRREIVATQVSNSIVNRASMVFAQMASEETGRGAGDIGRAYVVTRAVFGMRDLWSEIESLDNKVPATLQHEMTVALRRLLEHSALWFLRNRSQPLDCGATVGVFQSGVATLVDCLNDILPTDRAEEAAADATALVAQGVPEDLARFIGLIEPLYSACNIVEAAAQLNLGVRQVAEIYFQVGRRLGLDWLRARGRHIASDNHWQDKAVSAIIDDLYGQQLAVTIRVVETAGGGDGVTDKWAEDNPDIITRNAQLFTDLRTQPGMDLAMLAVANRRMRELITG
jgi:glutamate dehydrogenase